MPKAAGAGMPTAVGVDNLLQVAAADMLKIKEERGKMTTDRVCSMQNCYSPGGGGAVPVG
jgi:hypothetical protein